MDGGLLFLLLLLSIVVGRWQTGGGGRGRGGGGGGDALPAVAPPLGAASVRGLVGWMSGWMNAQARSTTTTATTSTTSPIDPLHPRPPPPTQKQQHTNHTKQPPALRRLVDLHRPPPPSPATPGPRLRPPPPVAPAGIGSRCEACCVWWSILYMCILYVIPFPSFLSRQTNTPSLPPTHTHSDNTQRRAAAVAVGATPPRLLPSRCLPAPTNQRCHAPAPFCGVLG